MIGILSVTYKEPFEACPLYESLQAIPSAEVPAYQVFNFYNASEVNQTNKDKSYTEQQSTDNGGLALGYNAGMQHFSKLAEVDQLLFLNSDCQLSANILRQYAQVSTDSDKDFFYPKLVCQNIVVSPFRKPGFDYDFYIIAWTLVKKSKLTYFTFDMRYWLDGIDYDFSVWFKQNGLIGKAIDATITHDLSVITSYKRTPDWRILNIYKTEKLFLNSGFNFILLKGIVRAIIHTRFKLSMDLFRLFFAAR